jgi:hypothetical protein
MGTRKKLLLASLVGLAMLLAFVLGAMPGYDQSRLAASGDQINIQDVLNALLAEEKGTELEVQSNVQAVLVKTPTGSQYVVPEIPLPLRLSESRGNTPVHYVASVEGDNTVWAGSPGNTPGGAGQWNGGANRAYTGLPVSLAPYAASLDLGTFVTGTAGVRSLLIYGLLGAQLQNSQNIQITYTSATIDPYTITVEEVDGAVTDIDGNGIPDQPANEVGDASIWTATVNQNGSERTVLVVNLDVNDGKGGAGTVFSQPEAGITVEAPSTAALVASSVIPANATALLVVQVVDNLADVLDEANGFASTQDWADAVLGIVPVSAHSIAGPIIDVSIIVEDNGSFSELDVLPGDLPVTITIDDLESDDNEVLSIFSYPTVVAEGNDGLVVSNEPGLQEWTLIKRNLGDGPQSVDVTELSVFVPFVLPAFFISDVAPNSAEEGEEVALTLTGTIPVAAGLSVAEASEIYVVTVNGTEASFRDGGNGFAIDPLVNGSTNAAYLTWTAAISTKATQQADIVVSEIVDGQLVELQNISNALQVIPTYEISVSAGAGGTAAVTSTPNGPNNTFVEGTAVTITATPDAGFQFLAWTGLLDGETNAATTTITASSDRSLTATFQEIPNGTTFTLTLSVAGNGSGTVSPSQPTVVNAGEVVTISATPASNSRFVNWTGNTAGVADVNSATTTVTVNADTNLVANFARRTPADEPLTVIGLDAAGGLNGEGQVEVWLFGGEVIRINGTGLIEGADLVSFQVGANPPVAADLYNVAPDGTFGLVVVPPTNATGSSSFFLATLRVTRPNEVAPFVVPNAIRYKQYVTGADDVTTTAFILDTPATGGTIDVSTQAGSGNFARLTLPGVDTAADAVYGIVRVAAQDSNKQNTGPVGTEAIDGGIAAAFGGAIPGTTAEATKIAGALDVAFYLYNGASDNAKQNTGSVGAPALQPANELLTFQRGSSGSTGDLPTPGDPEGNAGDAATFQYTLGGNATKQIASAITNGQVRDGLTVWGVETEYDYVTDTLIAVQNPQVSYQSQILAQEARSQGEAAKLAGADSVPVEELTMRLYTLNGFSLRQGLVAPPDVAAGMRLNTASGTASSDLRGGTTLTVVSPLGGLAWLERADFVIGGQVVGSTNQFVEIAGVDNGEDEFAVRFNAPASARAGIASIVLTGRANTTALQTVNLQNVFEYKAAPAAGNFPWLLVLLGLGAALLGLAAGGSSGGGGGGPCFIATAAYGTPLDGDINTLREVRDQFLLENTVGTAFTDTYYRVSPAIADTVASSPVLAAIVRVVLVPVIFLGKMALTSPALLALVALSIGFFFWSKRKGARQS